MRRFALAAAVASFFACSSVASAASVVIGPPTLAMGGGYSTTCYLIPSGSPCDVTVVQAQAPSGVRYASPGDGVITSWRVIAGVVDEGQVFLRVVRPVGGGQFKGIATSAAGTSFNGTTPNTTNLAVQAGDLIGADARATGSDAQIAPQDQGFGPGYSLASFLPHLPDGSTETPDGTGQGSAALNATVELYAPTLASISPNSGRTAGGETVTITGDHLANATGVTFGDAAGTIVSNTNTQITATAPPHAAGAVDVRVVTEGGPSAVSDAGRYTYIGDPPDLTVPKLSAFVVSPAAFQAANSGPAFVAAVGGRVVYKLSEPAAVKFTAERKLAGRKKGKRCVSPRKAPKGKRCSRYAAQRGSFTVTGAPGLNTFRFMGRFRNKALRPGNYRLVAVATDAAGNRSKAVRHAFRIKK